MPGETTIEHSAEPIPVRGEAPHKILWRGRQWAVTTYGVEALDGTYSFEASRLAEDLPAWSWIRQAGTKDWIDLPDFTTAFMVAIVLHGRAPGFDPAQILEHFRRAAKDQTAGRLNSAGR